MDNKSVDELLESHIEQTKKIALDAEKKSLVSIYILCRVLIEIVKQTPPDVLGDDLREKLEEIVFTQLRTTDPIAISVSVLRAENWNLFCDLLGYMSEKKFLSVSDRFIESLEKIPENISKDDAIHIHVLIHGMRKLRLSVYPILEESAEFIESIAKFFKKTKNDHLLIAYCETLSYMLLPIAEVITAEANHPTWVTAINNLYEKGIDIINNGKIKSQIASIKLISSTLSVSSKDLFTPNWLKFIENNYNKFKSKFYKNDFINLICQFIWVLMFRCSETLNNQSRKLDIIFTKILFPINSKKQWITNEINLLIPTIQLIRFISFNNLHYIIDNVITPMLQSNIIMNNQLNQQSILENISQEKLIISIRSYIEILIDLQLRKRPHFPTEILLNEYKKDYLNFNYQFHHNISSDTSKIEELDNDNDIDNDDLLSHYFIPIGTFHQDFCLIFEKLFLILDVSIGNSLNSNSNEISQQQQQQQQSKTQSTISSLGFHFGSSNSNNDQSSILKSNNKKILNYELFANLIYSIPWCLPQSIPYPKLIEVLCRNSIHKDLKISKSSINSLKILARRSNARILINTFARFSFDFDEKSWIHYDASYFTSNKFISLLKLYVDLLYIWLDSFKKKTKKELKEQLQQQQQLKLNIYNHSNSLSETNNNNINSNGKEIDNKSGELEWKNIITVIEEVEGNGLFFLCSQDCTIRKLAISILKLTSDFDLAIKESTELKYKNINSIKEENEIENEIENENENEIKISTTTTKTTTTTTTTTINSDITTTPGNSSTTTTINSKLGHSRKPSVLFAEKGTRLVSIFESLDYMELLPVLPSDLSGAERQRLSKLHGKRKDLLLKLAESDYGVDSALWFRVFPKLLTVCFNTCPMAMALCRDIVCVRLVQMHESIIQFAESEKLTTSSNLRNNLITTTPPEILIEQWKLYLIVACVTVTSTGEQKMHLPKNSNNNNHGRKKSLQMFTVQYQKITSARSIFIMVIPLLKSEHSIVRDAVVSAVSSININIFKTLIECIEPIILKWKNNIYNNNNLRNIQTLNNKIDGRLRIELTNILNSTSHFLKNEIIYNDNWILKQLISFIKDLKYFLSQRLIQYDIEYQKLRRYFCGLLENIYISINLSINKKNWLPFEGRVACFTFLEEWCEHGQFASSAQDRYDYMQGKPASRIEAGMINASIEFERSSLEYAAIKCMAVLCAGPLVKEIESTDENEKIEKIESNSEYLSFDIPGLTVWLKSVIGSKEKIQRLGKKALMNLLKENPTQLQFFETIISQCYDDNNSTIGGKYFLVISDLLIKFPNYPIKICQVFALGLFKIGDSNFEVRQQGFKLLESMEKRFWGTNYIHEFEVTICSHSLAVYKRSMFNISTRFATEYSNENYQIISELTKYFHVVSDRSRKDLLTVLLPWVHTVELKTEDGWNKYHANTMMVLNNLFEITIRFGDVIQNEVEALWVALAYGGSPENLQIILDFIIRSSLELKNPTFVEYGRQVMVYLAMAPGGTSLMDTLLTYLEPREMIPPQPNDRHLPDQNPEDIDESNKLPYIANLTNVLNHPAKENFFSHGQLALIFLVDIFTVSNDVMGNNLPLLLHVSFVLFDHYLPIVQNQAAAMLIHLIHGLTTPDEPASVEAIKMIKKHSIKTPIWTYDDLNSEKNGIKTPKDMDDLVKKVLEAFASTVPDLREQWSHVSLTWATTCAVRHIACRSFQLFRSLLTYLDQSMLKDMLHRLSNTISDETSDIQGFSMQILMTLHTVTTELDSEKLIDFPQLFWTSVACLSTVCEQEFIEVLNILEKFVSKIDLDTAETVSCLISTFPAEWEGKFDGIQPLILIGLRSANTYDHTLRLLDKLDHLQNSKIIGGSNRLLLSFLANAPRLLYTFNEKGPGITQKVIDAANQLTVMADAENMGGMSRITTSVAENRFRSKEDFLSQSVQVIQQYFSEYDAETLVFLLGLLSNKIDWVKIETMELLKHYFPLVDLQREEFAGVGADLISPLLRLLLTDYADKALEVLDKTVSISGSQMDKDILRMSLGNKTLRKEYEKAPTLFGIPDESGWAISMPAVTSMTTRHNVHAVFLNCEVPFNTEEVTPNEEIQFHMEEYYVPPMPVDDGDQVSSSGGDRDASLSHMWAALDNLDNFFTASISGVSNTPATTVHGHSYTTSVDTRYSNDSSIMPVESAPQIYDKSVSDIFSKLARSPSAASFRKSLADSFGNNPVPTGEPLYSQQRTSYMSLRGKRGLRKNSMVNNLSNPIPNFFGSNPTSPNYSFRDDTESISAMMSPMDSSIRPSSPTSIRYHGATDSLSTENGGANGDAIFRFESLLNGSVSARN